MSLDLEHRGGCFRVPAYTHMAAFNGNYLGQWRGHRWINEEYLDLTQSYKLPDGKIIMYLSQSTEPRGANSWVRSTVKEMCLPFTEVPDFKQMLGQGVLW